MEPSGSLFVEAEGVVMIGILSVKLLQADDAVNESKGGSLLITVGNHDIGGSSDSAGDVCFCWIRMSETTGVMVDVVDSSEAL